MHLIGCRPLLNDKCSCSGKTNKSQPWGSSRNRRLLVLSPTHSYCLQKKKLGGAQRAQTTAVHIYFWLVYKLPSIRTSRAHTSGFEHISFTHLYPGLRFMMGSQPQGRGVKIINCQLERAECVPFKQALEGVSQSEGRLVLKL